MKVTQAHLDEMSNKIKPLDTPEVREMYRTGNIPRNDFVKDIDRRYRWDLYYAAARQSGGMPDSTNGYNMDHIDTALRAIVSPL